MEEEKKKGVVEKSGEELGKVANKGVVSFTGPNYIRFQSSRSDPYVYWKD